MKMSPREFIDADLRTSRSYVGIGGLGQKVKEYGYLCYSVYTELFLFIFSFLFFFSKFFIYFGWVDCLIYICNYYVSLSI